MLDLDCTQICYRFTLDLVSTHDRIRANRNTNSQYILGSMFEKANKKMQDVPEIQYIREILFCKT